MDIWTIDQWIAEPSNCAPEEHNALAWPADQELHGLRLTDSRSCCTRPLMERCEAMLSCRWGDRAPVADPATERRRP